MLVNTLMIVEITISWENYPCLFIRLLTLFRGVGGGRIKCPPPQISGTIRDIKTHPKAKLGNIPYRGNAP